MCKGCKPLVSSLIELHRGTFDSYRTCMIDNYHIYGTTRHSIFTREQKERYCHLYVSSAKMATEWEKIEVELDKMKSTFRLMKNSPADFGLLFTEHFDCHYK